MEHIWEHELKSDLDRKGSNCLSTCMLAHSLTWTFRSAMAAASPPSCPPWKDSLRGVGRRGVCSGWDGIRSV